MKATVYTSSKRQKTQLQKQKSIGFEHNPNAENCCINVYTDLRYQKMLGFGSAITDSSAAVYKKMSQKVKDEFITAAFDKEKGLGLNFCRTTIGSCDFSEDVYSYIEEGDYELKTFDISHDKEQIIPLILQAYKQSGEKFKVFASPWSPPKFLKDNDQLNYGGKLKEENYEVWARYFAKYVKAYRENGVNLFGVTVQNEPMASQTWESCLWTAKETAIFVRDYLSTALENEGVGDTKVMIWDHNKEHVYDWAKALKETEGASEKVWGIAFHHYSGEHFDSLKFAKEILPTKQLVESEFCYDLRGMSWYTAVRMANELIGNINNFTSAITDWNILLDTEGGPFHWRRTGCSSPFQYDEKNDKLIATPVATAFSHFSKFVKKGAVRLGVSSYSSFLCSTAFQNPDGSLVVVVLNKAKKKVPLNLRINEDVAQTYLKPNSITTFVISK